VRRKDLAGRIVKDLVGEVRRIGSRERWKGG